MFNIQNFTFRHNNSSESIFLDFCYVFEDGITTIVAKNGAGKTTLLTTIVDAFVDKHNKRESTLAGNFVFDPATRIITITQNPNDCLLGWYSAMDNLKVIAKCSNISKNINYKKYQDDLCEFAIPPDQKVATLSGGQKQIVNILKSMSFGANLILMDEPFAALDLYNSIKLKKTLKQWQNKHKACMILISHNLDDILELSNTILLLDCKPAKIVAELKNTDKDFDSNKNRIIQFLDTSK